MFSHQGKRLTFLLAKSSDFDDVVKLSEGIYNGRDYLPLVLHQWLQMDNLHLFLGHVDNKPVCAAACFTADDGNTSASRAGRVVPELRGHGLYGMLERALEDYV